MLVKFALIGLLGILVGEQVVPVAKRLFAGHDLVAYLRTDCAEQVLGHPVKKPDDQA